jgi:hypothetical protein
MNRPSKYNKLTYLQKMSQINRRLRRGDITNIANEMGCSVAHVSDVVNGKQVNERIVNRAYDSTRGRMENSEKLLKQ